MSDSVVKIVPINPDAIPHIECVAALEKFLSVNYHSDDQIVGVIDDNVQFRDSGENLEEIQCPHCGVDLHEFWPDWMDQSFSRDHFSHREITTPCCSQRTDLNDLAYSWPVAFSRFEVSLRNPGTQISASHLAAIGKILGFPVKQLFSHI